VPLEGVQLFRAFSLAGPPALWNFPPYSVRLSYHALRFSPWQVGDLWKLDVALPKLAVSLAQRILVRTDQGHDFPSGENFRKLFLFHWRPVRPLDTLKDINKGLQFDDTAHWLKGRLLL